MGMKDVFETFVFLHRRLIGNLGLLSVVLALQFWF